MILKVQEACQAIRDISVPTIAEIDGRCLGAGLELAASCDFRYATQKAVFGMPEVCLGVSPSGPGTSSCLATPRTGADPSP